MSDISAPRSSNVVIVGAGPAGMILALLLARRGLTVKVIERNPDFHREFRGEVLQPRFWHAVTEAGLADLFTSIPQEKFDALRFFVRGTLRGLIKAADIDKTFPFFTWMTQPDMLTGLKAAADAFPGCHVEFGSRVTGLIRDGGQVCGITYETASGDIHEHHAKVVVGSDGRFSALRKLGDFKLSHQSHQFDVMWFEMERPESYVHGADIFLGDRLNCLILPKRPHKIQCGLLISPGSFKKFREAGTESLAAMLDATHPMFREFSRKLIDFKSFTLLSAVVERVSEWAQDGLLLIGDAAHTCSPAGAVGVTIAVETAIVADNVTARCFKLGDFSKAVLDNVQRRREPEVLKVHKIQERAGLLLAQNPLPRSISTWIMGFLIGSGIAPRIMRGMLTRRADNPLLAKMPD